MKRTAFALALALATGLAVAAPVTYRIDPNHTSVTASWSHYGFSNPIAHFGEVAGSITYDAARPANSSVDVTIPLSGLESHVDAFNDHLRSADFFDAATYPEMTFRSTKVQPNGKGRLKVTGDLTIRGVTRPAVLDVTINRIGVQPRANRPAAGFHATTTLKRSDFGLGKHAPAVSDAVTIRITTQAVVPRPAG